MGLIERHSCPHFVHVGMTVVNGGHAANRAGDVIEQAFRDVRWRSDGGVHRRKGAPKIMQRPRIDGTRAVELGLAL